MADARRGKPGPNRAALGGGGPSTVGVTGSMRARDVSRPHDDDVAAAEKRLVIRRVPADQPFKPKAKPGTTPDEPRTR